MERTNNVNELNERRDGVTSEMQSSVKDEKKYLKLRKELKRIRRKLARLKYSEMIKSSGKGR